MLYTQVDDLTCAGNTVAVEDFEFGHFEGRGNLVLDDFDACLIADNLVALLDCADAANVESNRRVELERVAARRGFRVAEHDADLHSNLVNENHHRVRAIDVGGQLSECL